MCAGFFILQLSTNFVHYFSPCLVCWKFWGAWGGCFVFVGFFLQTLSLLRLPASVCSGCLYAVNSLSKSYFSFSQFYIVEVDFVTQKTPRENSNQKWHRQKVMGISEETETFFVPSSQEVKAVLHVSDSLIFIPVTLNNKQYSDLRSSDALCSRKGQQPFTVPRPSSGLRAGSNRDLSISRAYTSWLSKREYYCVLPATERYCSHYKQGSTQALHQKRKKTL